MENFLNYNNTKSSRYTKAKETKELLQKKKEIKEGEKIIPWIDNFGMGTFTAKQTKTLAGDNDIDNSSGRNKDFIENMGLYQKHRGKTENDDEEKREKLGIDIPSMMGYDKIKKTSLQFAEKDANEVQRAIEGVYAATVLNGKTEKQKTPDYQDTGWWLELNKENEKQMEPFYLFSDNLWTELAMTYLEVFEGLKHAEADATMKFPQAAVQVNEARKLAGTAKSVLFAEDPNREVDGAKANAFLHAYWNAVMSYKINEEQAERFATAHETYSDAMYIDNKILDQIDEETGLTVGQNVDMDMYNNKVGRDIGSRVKKLDKDEIHKELLDQYGSQEQIDNALEKFPDFDEVDLFLAQQVKQEMDRGALRWIFDGVKHEKKNKKSGYDIRGALSRFALF